MLVAVLVDAVTLAGFVGAVVSVVGGRRRADARRRWRRRRVARGGRDGERRRGTGVAGRVDTDDGVHVLRPAGPSAVVPRVGVAAVRPRAVTELRSVAEDPVTRRAVRRLVASHASATDVWVTDVVRRFAGAESLGGVRVGRRRGSRSEEAGWCRRGGGGASHAEVETLIVDLPDVALRVDARDRVLVIRAARAAASFHSFV